MKKKFLDILSCPICKTTLKRNVNDLICKNKHVFQIKNEVPVMSPLDSYLEIEAKAWEDEWKNGVGIEAFKAYQYNMRIFKKLKFWEESGEAAKFIKTQKSDVILDMACGNGLSTSS